MENKSDTTPSLAHQNYGQISIVAVIAFILIIVSGVVEMYLPETLYFFFQIANQLIYAWLIYQFGLYLHNFVPPTARLTIYGLTGMVLLRAAVDILIRLTEFRHPVLSISLTVLFFGLYLAIGLRLFFIRNDFVGGLKTVGFFFAIKAILLLLVLFLFIYTSYFVEPEVTDSTNITMWNVSLYAIQFADLFVYFTFYKIFSWVKRINSSSEN